MAGDVTPPGTMKMVDHKASPRGNIVATYEPGGDVETGTFPSPPPSEREKHSRRR